MGPRARGPMVPWSVGVPSAPDVVSQARGPVGPWAAGSPTQILKKSKKSSKFNEILSVWDEKNTSRSATTRGMDWTPPFGAENE